MAKILTFNKFKTRRTPGKVSKKGGYLCVFESMRDIPFIIKRVFYIYKSSGGIRGGHRHKKAIVGLSCVYGKFEIYVNNGKTEKTYTLHSPEKCLIIEPKDWHTMQAKEDNSVLLCF